MRTAITAWLDLTRCNLVKLSLMLLIATFSACESLTDSQTSREIQTYQIGESTIQLVLDEEYRHPDRKFNTLEEYDHFKASVEKIAIEKNELILNKGMYQALSHYFTPFEVYAMDSKAEVHIGSNSYKATDKALYKLLNGNWEVEVYFGLSGDVDLKEHELIIANRNNISALSNYEFLDPSAKRRYESLKAALSAPKQTPDPDQILALDYNYYYFHENNSGTGALHEFKYRNSATGPIYTAHIRWYCWDETYRSGGDARARGGTITEIYRLHDLNGWVPLPDNNTPIGSHHEDGSLDVSLPWTSVTVITYNSFPGSIKQSRTSDAESWRVSRTAVHRNNDMGTDSYHSANIRYNNVNTNSPIMVGHYVPY